MKRTLIGPWFTRMFRSRSRSDRRFGVPRVWSNQELRKFASLFSGEVLNVSGWKDEDKQGERYRDYFVNCSSYYISNYDQDKKGLVGLENEFYLDLEQDLRPELANRFDVCFSHTVLEHIYDLRKAFRNICLMSRDVVITVVPYIQQMHGLGYGDYWRFTPQSMKRLHEDNGLTLRYCSANGADRASVYLFCIGMQSNIYHDSIPERFDMKIDASAELYADGYRNVIGGNMF